MKPVLAVTFVFATAFAGTTLAEDAGVLATYHTDNCCVPPEGAYEVDVTVLKDGALTLIRCEGYETEGPGCRTRRAKATPAALEAILKAAADSGLAGKPAARSLEPSMGGGGTSGSVMLDGSEVILPRDPANEDAERVALVLRAIRDALPARLDRFLED